MDSRTTKRKRLTDDAAAPASPSRPQKRLRKLAGPSPSPVIDQNETQSVLGGDPRSGMDDSDVQEESIQEIAMLQRRNQQLTNQNETLKGMMEASLRHVFELEARLNRVEFAMRDQRQQGPIADLPYEMIYVIFGFLPLGDLLSCEIVCRNWRLSLIEWLRVLDLSPYNNAVNNSVISNVSKYHKLESLCLARCKDVTDPALSTIVESFQNLRDLDIFGCQVTDLGQLKGLEKLQCLRVGDSLVIDDNHLKNLPPQIRSLRLEWLLGVQNEGLANISHLTNLVSLTIEQNDNMKQNSMILPESLAPTLKRFVVIRQAFFNDVCLDSLSRFNNLEKLSLYWVPIVGNGFASMKEKMGNLKKLVLKRCHIFANAGLDALTRSLPHLKKLEIKGLTSVDREGFRVLNRMNHLKDLRLRLGRQVIDEEISDLEFLANMRLHRLELIDAIGLTGIGIKKIVDTQEYTLEQLLLSDCHLLHSADMLPLKRLKRLTYFDVHHATHLSKSEENFTFQLLPAGGIDFDFEADYYREMDREEMEMEEEGVEDDLMDNNDEDMIIVPPRRTPADLPHNNIPVFGIPPVRIPPVVPGPRQQRFGMLFDPAGRMRADMPGVPNVNIIFPQFQNDDEDRDLILIDMDAVNDAVNHHPNEPRNDNDDDDEDEPAPSPYRRQRRRPPPRRR